MGPAVAVLAVGVVAVTAFAGCVLAFGGAGPGGSTAVTVLYPAGWIIFVDSGRGGAGQPVENFSLTGTGGVLIGSIRWDHGSVQALVAPPNSLFGCPALVGYYGSPWTQTLNVTLAPGHYDFGSLCGGFGNGTVTQTIEVVSR